MIDDPSRYLSAPDLSWDVMLKMTKIKLELISDPGMYIFLKKQTISNWYISNRSIRKKNPKKINLKSYDPKQDSKHITYLDANNLYGYAISRFLPTSGFKWIDHKEFDLNKYPSNSSKGCVLKVDLEYPKVL